MRRVVAAIIAVLIPLGCDADAGRTGHEEGAGRPANVSPVAPSQTIPLPGVGGRIDHMALDAKGKRLFVAAPGSGTVEMIDLKAGKVVGRIGPLAKPQGIAFAPDCNRVAVATEKDGLCQVYDGTTLQLVGSVDLGEDADNVRYDARAMRFYVGFGKGGLAVIDPQTARDVGEIKLEEHPESFQLESGGGRIFVNLPSSGRVAVVGPARRTVVETWSVKAGMHNFPMALDEARHRLFVACRIPALLVILDAETGKWLSGMPCVADADDVFYDPSSGRIFVSGGEGYVSVFLQGYADRYELLGNVPTARGARTSLFDPETGNLYVAVPQDGTQHSELRVFKMKGVE